jgi:hypothetical protein
VPVDQLVHLREAPLTGRLVPAARERLRIVGLCRQLEPALFELGLVPLDLVLDRAEAAHPHRRPAECADRRVRARPEVPEPLLERVPLERAHRELFLEHPPLLAVARRFRPDRALAHDRLGLSRVHRLGSVPTA